MLKQDCPSRINRLGQSKNPCMSEKSVSSAVHLSRLHRTGVRCYIELADLKIRFHRIPSLKFPFFVENQMNSGLPTT